MTAQALDKLEYKNKKYEIFEHGELFDINKYGFKLKWVCTALYKGYLVIYEIKDNQLFIKHLYVNTSDKNYPTINNVEAKPVNNKNSYLGSMYLYENLNMKLNYSGKIKGGCDYALHGTYMRSPFWYGGYREIKELTFENGILVLEEEIDPIDILKQERETMLKVWGNDLTDEKLAQINEQYEKKVRTLQEEENTFVKKLKGLLKR